MSGQVILVGSPNVGKSLLFNRLTSSYSTVSNYPGTTVTVSRGKMTSGIKRIEVMDTPGMYSLLPLSEEERVARDALFESNVAAVIHVVDAKNIRRMLSLTLSLIELGLPVILAVNMMDEAERLGLFIDCDRLRALLGIPVVPTTATKGMGVRELKEAVFEVACRRGSNVPPGLTYDERIESLLSAINLKGEYTLNKRGIALLLIQGDPVAQSIVRRKEGSRYSSVERLVKEARDSLQDEGVSVEYLVVSKRFEFAERFATACVKRHGGFGFPASHTSYRGPWRGLYRLLDRLTITPITGVPIAILAIYVVLYRFVGLFGAGYMVEVTDSMFRSSLNPLLESIVGRNVPIPALADLLVGEFGMLTLGLRYAVAIILPIVGAFFLAFSVIEDSGYLPRIALLVDRMLKPLGLEGRAIIPLTLGLGCGTMAAMVTRTLADRKERLIAIFLLSLAVPCSAQMGLIFAILSEYPKALAMWLLIVVIAFLMAGRGLSSILSSKPRFSIEVPPLRLPSVRNVLWKTCARMQWYFLEAFPIFLAASAFIWLAQMSGLLDVLLGLMGRIMMIIGLPKEVSIAFIFGFLRRDYGAAGLYDYRSLMDLNELLVSCVVLTLFVPCIAQVLVVTREKGIIVSSAVAVVSFSIAFGTGFALNFALEFLGAVFE